jgi:hypothetical protein
MKTFIRAHRRKGRTVHSHVRKMKPKRFDIRDVANKSALKKYAAEKGYKFKFKPVKEMYGFAGLHHGDGVAWDVDIGPKDIWIDKSLDGKYKFEVMRHEVEENQHWKEGDPIWKAHKKSIRHEKYNSRNWDK